MPKMNGLEATRYLMQHKPTPIVVISSGLDRDVQLSLKAVEAGAVSVMSKLPSAHSPSFMRKRHELLTALRAMAGVSVVTRRSYSERKVVVPDGSKSTDTRPRILALGASTGGPSAVQRLLHALPHSFPLPIVLVQHMPAEFLPGLVRWLDESTHFVVSLAGDGTQIHAGEVYVAPGEQHLRISTLQDKLVTRLVTGTNAERHTPSVDQLFASLADTCGAQAIGVLLTGMGDDGAAGLLQMRQAGAITLAQDAASSTVFGMPRAAIARGAVQAVISLQDLPSKITKML